MLESENRDEPTLILIDFTFSKRIYFDLPIETRGTELYMAPELDDCKGNSINNQPFLFLNDFFFCFTK